MPRNSGRRNTVKGRKKVLKSKSANIKTKKQSKKSKPTYRVGQIERIDWIDHNLSSAPWQDFNPSSVRILGTTVGKVVGETDEYVSLVQTWNDGDRQVGSVFNVVKACITKRKKLG